MNFLLHRHLGARDLGSATAGLGAMLPDLWRMADRHVRPGAVDPSPLAQPPDELLSGIQHHLAVDRWFHASAVFVDGERDASFRLQQARMSARHSVLLAHVLWELCLDGELVRREGRDRVVAEIREGVRHAGPGLPRAAEIHYFSRVAEGAERRPAFEARVEQICRALVSGPWVERYQTGEGLSACIQGLRVRVGLARMTADDEARLADVARTLLERAVDGVERILAMPTFAA